MSQGRNPRARFLRSLVIVSTLLPGLLRAQEQDTAGHESATEKEILAIESMKNDAMQKGDSKVLEQIYGDTLLFVNARGQLLTKKERMKEFDSGNVKYVSFRQGDYRFHIYGNTVVLTGIACSVVDYHGTINRIPRRFTSTYVKLEGRWRFVAHQATLVGDQKAEDLQYCSN